MNRALALFGLVAALGLAACSPTIGSPCAQSSDCATQGNRVCDTSQPNGYCTVFGCGDNTCPDHAVCVSFNAMLPGCGYNDYQAPARTSRTLCLEHCQSDSDCRVSDGYVCVDPMAAPLSAHVLDDNWNQKVCVVAATPVDAGLQEGGSAVCNAGRLVPDAGAGSDAEAADETPATDAGVPDAPDAADAGSADAPDGG
jgi:hypothetical protein